MSCEVISDPRYFGGAPTFFCYSDDRHCSRCGLESLGGGRCDVCELVERDRAAALKLARSLKYALGPFCQFCESDEETVLCDWKDVKPTPKLIRDAEVGDVWITQRAGKRGVIKQIMNLDAKRQVTNDVFYGRRIWVAIPKHPTYYPYERGNGASFMTEAIGTCDRQCCWRHQREVGENRHYCKAHWDSWQGVKE